jgi:hydrogenase maturation protein HypF
MGKQDTCRNRFRITGQVQGVGFRPFAYRLASELRLSGWVHNDSRGVTIEVQGSSEAIAVFSRRLHGELPPLASIENCEETQTALVAGEDAFIIRPSAEGELADAQVTVDTAVCADCLREMADPADPRFGYAFINCTNCGPRYTIVRRIPYDRPNTTMDGFPMCPLCRGEYEDPRSRRFHAQPIACPTCGPRLWLTDSRGQAILPEKGTFNPPRRVESPLFRAAELLAAGRILAIKGLGGFHLACRADDDHAVRRLRSRKHRDAKPFAVMVAGLGCARKYAQIDPDAIGLLTGPLRPIVLLPAIRPSGIAPSVAEGLATLGIMLPYTPLHHLLFAQPPLADLPLVMTSGNYSDEPLVKDNDDAVAHLGKIADALLLHDRPIERRVDDSVVQTHPDGHCNVLRRARGYAPAPVRVADILSARGEGVSPSCAAGILPASSPFPAVSSATRQQQQKQKPDAGKMPATHADKMSATREDKMSSPHAGETPAPQLSILAVGAELKNTVCLLRGGRALLSEHIGDLKDGRTYRHFIDTINHLEALFDVHPRVIAADLHPQYLSTQYALKRHRGELADKAPLPIVRVQHHHAHIVACMAENGHAGPVIGLACDGVGLGDDGAVWGCEVLRADAADYQRLGHLRYVPLPGGDAAARETARPALAALWDAFGREILEMPVARQLAGGEAALDAAVQMIEAKVNCPPSSSLGRWFDAAAALCGLAARNDFEGQAPMKLEGAIAAGVENCYEFKVVQPTVVGGGHPCPTPPGKRGQAPIPNSGIGASPLFQIDLRPMTVEMVADLSAGLDVGVIAARFHNTVAAFLLESARRAREATGLNVVALSGGCFVNRYLLARLKALLPAARFELLLHRNLPVNDGCVALGQAVVAAAKTQR